MQLKKLLKPVWILVMLAAGYIPPSLAESAAQPEAHVSSEALSDSARMVFTWDSLSKVPFSIENKDTHIVLRFGEPVALEWGSALDTLHDYVRQIETRQNGKTVILTLVCPLEAKRYLSYTRKGIDLSENGIVLSQTKNKTPLATLKIPQPRKKIAKATTPVSTAKATPATVHEVAQLAALSPAAGSPAAAVPEKNEVVAAADPTPPAAVPATPKEVIVLPMKDDEPYAVFVRKKMLWVVAGTGSSLSLDTFHKANLQSVKDVQKLANTQANIFYMTLVGDIYASIEKNSPQEINIVLRKEVSKPAENLTPLLHANAAKQSLIAVSAPKASQIISLHDPLMGDELRVAPLPGAGTGTPVLYSFSEFNLLPTAQGLVVQKIADDAALAIQKGVVEITVPKGLVISAEMTQRLQEAESEAASAAQASATLFPYARWKPDDEKNFVPIVKKLTHDITYSKPDAANKARLKLLGIYLSQGLFPEALGMSEDILRSSLKFYRANKIAALRGAAYFFMYHINDAERDFQSPELADSLEIKMWLILCKELLGESTETFSFLTNYDRYIRYYPPAFIQKLAVIAADRSINRKEYDTATTIFETLKKDNIEEPVKKYTDYMRAKVLSETRGEEEAAKIWERQAGSVEDPLIRARAEFSLVNMLLRQDKITHEDAIKRLEKLRIVWRGDGLELNVLTLLGDLYIEEKLYGKALHTLRDIVLYYSDTPEALTTAKQMEETFVALYNKGGADTMPPLEALSLFYEFRDLVPIGKEGDQMIRNLADRLVNIDLLDRAALLLDHQVRKRLQGDDRSRIGARLALIYLLNHQPKEALETLKTTGYGDLPADLKLTRLRLTAQALAQQGQVDKAIDVLSSDNSADGTLLRLSIYWDNKDWPNVVTTAEEILGNRNDPSAALTPQESDVLLKLATAYVYEHDTGQIQYLRDYFTPLLKNNANKDSFLFITSESGSIDYSNLVNLNQDITTVKSFLSNYRDKIKKNGLSKTIN